MQRILLLSASALLVITASGAQAKSMKWMDATGAGLPAGAKMAVVSGDPGKATNFKVQIKMPANYVVPPHHHPTDEVVRVRSGTLSYGMGDKLDKSNAGTLSDPKTHVTMQAGMNHWVYTTDAALVEVTGMGPFQIVYVNPADDPRGASK
jgi:quercetin dioxygenase-like cupin family protein